MMMMSASQGQEPCDEPLPFITTDRPVFAQMLPCSTPMVQGQTVEEEVPASPLACITNTLERDRPNLTWVSNPMTMALDKVQPYFNSVHNSAAPVSDALDNVKPHFYSMQSSMRPFHEFCILTKPDGDGWNRLKVNLRHYRSNYTMGFFALSSAIVLFSPHSLFAIGILAAVWSIYYTMGFFALSSAIVLFSPHSLIAIGILAAVWSPFLKKKSEDPEWTLQIGSYELSKTKQWIILDTFTGFVLLFAVGMLFLSVLVFAAVITSLAATGHAAMHPLPESITDTSDAMETGSLPPLADGETPAALENGSSYPLSDDTSEAAIDVRNVSLNAPAISLDNMD